MARYSKLDQLSEDSDDNNSDDGDNLLYVKPNSDKSKKSTRHNGFTKIDINDASSFENICMHDLSKDVEDLDLRHPSSKQNYCSCLGKQISCYKRILFGLILLFAIAFTVIILYGIPWWTSALGFTNTTAVESSAVSSELPSQKPSTATVVTVSSSVDIVTTRRTLSNHSKTIDNKDVSSSSPSPVRTTVIPEQSSSIKSSTSTAIESAASISPSTNTAVTDSSEHFDQVKFRSRRTDSWTKFFNHTASKREWSSLDTESCIRLFDVDEDGALDIIMGLASGMDVTGELTPDLINETCHKQGMEPPCLGTLLALRGNDSKVLWSFYTNNEVFEINCNIDINKDGRSDCLGAGRLGTFVAFNPYNGSVYWRINQNVVNMQWNIYNALVLTQDFTNDGVPEIILPHGGEPRLPPEEHNRTAGRLLMLDGAKGVPVGRHLDMPENRETYMSPILYTHPDGSEYILFGSGGETISGSFMGISVQDFYRYALKLPRNETVPGSRGAYTAWRHKPTNDIGVFEIYRSKTKGVMVSPLIIDMNGDNYDDILMSAYDGTLALFNGENLNITWMSKFPGHESYSTPAPGQFNDDDVIDFMVHWSPGMWPKYQYSSLMVIDGSDGHVIWMMNSSQYEMSSDLVLRTTDPKRDLFVFRTQGREEWIIEQTGVVHGIHPQRVIHKRAVEDISRRKHRMRRDGEKLYNIPEGSAPLENITQKQNNFTAHTEETDGDFEDEEVNDCDLSLKSFYSELFIVDKTTLLSPVKIYEMPAQKFHYNLTESDRKMLIDEEIKYNGKNMNPALSAENFNYGPFCAVLKPEERTTGAIGDVDGDGKLDLIVIFGMNAQLRDAQGSYIKMRYDLQIVKLNLEELIRNPDLIYLNSTTTTVKFDAFSQNSNHVNISNVTFLPYYEQPWTAYMGTLGDSVFRLSNKYKDKS